jgi:SM-20-related protein
MPYFRVDSNRVSAELAEQGFSIVESGFDPAYADAVRTEISRFQAEGKMRSAAIGRAGGKALHPEIRGDGTCWFEPDALTDVQAPLWEFLESMRENLNRHLFVGLWDLEGHYAVYPPGGFYRKHVDRFLDDSKRTVSVVLFFNDSWRSEDGGALALDLPAGSREILPRAGTIVFFLSDRIAHEVMLTHRERASFAGWYRTR